MGSIPDALIFTIPLLAAIALVKYHPRWYSYAIAFVPLMLLSFFGLIIFGPIYVPSLVMLVISMLLKALHVRPRRQPKISEGVTRTRR